MKVTTMLCIAGLLCSCRPAPGSNKQQRLPEQHYHSETVVMENLEVPWGIDQLPDGNLLFTERNGSIYLTDNSFRNKRLIGTRKIDNPAEGGLLGLAIDPEFIKTGYIFLYETVVTGNRIVRLRLDNLQLTDETILVRGIPKAKYHDGGALRFGPDGYLYAGTGDARQPNLAQDTASLAGKILRMTRDGQPAADNPFGSLIYSYGHRNVQGLAWDAGGQLFASEHGPSGEINGWCCHDELNKIVMGGNYGWPLVIGNDTCPGCILPVAHSGNDTWAPGGLVFVNDKGPAALQGKLVMACLRGRKLLVFQPGVPLPEQVLYDGTYKRLRNIIQLANGELLMATSNRDGRETFPDKTDDRMIRIPAGDAP
jgi:glucose/arabinose dehydrogenase